MEGIPRSRYGPLLPGGVIGNTTGFGPVIRGSSPRRVAILGHDHQWECVSLQQLYPSPVEGAARQDCFDGPEILRHFAGCGTRVANEVSTSQGSP